MQYFFLRPSPLTPDPSAGAGDCTPHWSYNRAVCSPADAIFSARFMSPSSKAIFISIDSTILRSLSTSVSFLSSSTARLDPCFSCASRRRALRILLSACCSSAGSRSSCGLSHTPSSLYIHSPAYKQRHFSPASSPLLIRSHAHTMNISSLRIFLCLYSSRRTSSLIPAPWTPSCGSASRNWDTPALSAPPRQLLLPDLSLP